MTKSTDKSTIACYLPKYQISIIFLQFFFPECLTQNNVYKLISKSVSLCVQVTADARHDQATHTSRSATASLDRGNIIGDSTSHTGKLCCHCCLQRAS